MQEHWIASEGGELCGRDEHWVSLSEKMEVCPLKLCAPSVWFNFFTGNWTSAYHWMCLKWGHFNRPRHFTFKMDLLCCQVWGGFHSSRQANYGQQEFETIFCLARLRSALFSSSCFILLLASKSFNHPFLSLSALQENSCEDDSMLLNWFLIQRDLIVDRWPNPGK